MNTSVNLVPDERTFSYEIDGLGRIVSVSPSFEQHAVENNCPELRQNEIVGKVLWHFISDRHTTLMHELIVSVAHARKKSIVWRFRCDSADWYRVMESVVEPLENGHTRYTNRYVTQISRPAVGLLDPNQSRSDEFVRVCSWCKGVIQGKHVVTIEYMNENFSLRRDKALPQLVHGMCHDCYDQQSEALDQQS